VCRMDQEDLRGIIIVKAWGIIVKTISEIQTDDQGRQ
jgi:hypothetical protein